MIFDRESLRGIFLALPEADRDAIGNICTKRGVRRNAYNTVIDADLYIVQEVMVELGHIAPFAVSLSEQWAEEYEEIMAIQELIP